MLKNIFLFVAGLLFSVPSIAQTLPSGEAPGLSIWVGATVSTFNPDYGCSDNAVYACWGGHLWGISPYASTNTFLFGRIGAEAQAHFLRWHGPANLTETTYMAGPRVQLFRRRQLILSGRFLAGGARFSVPAPSVGTGSYFAMAPGASLDYRMSRRMSARLEYEYQMWPSFKGSGGGSGGLTPNGLSLGLSYAIRRP